MIRVLLAFSIIALQSSRESYFGLLFSTVMLTRASHAKNGFLPIVMTELGIVKAVNPPHLANAPSAMEVTELGIVMLVRPLH